MIHLTVLGEGGLLGQEIAKIGTSSPDICYHASPNIRWSDSAIAIEQIQEHLKSLTRDTHCDKWAVIWAAGAAVPASSEADTALELGFFDQFIGVLDRVQEESQTEGVFIYASSAGAVYGSSVNPPFTEASIPVPNSPYGRLKLACETRAHQLARPQLKVASLRIANLYGPGQKLFKAQGLISHLLRSTILRREIGIYVPLETTRDYLYAPDCADVFLRAVTHMCNSESPNYLLKNVATGTVVSIGALLSLTHRLVKRAPLVVIASSPLVSRQAVDMRVRSETAPHLDPHMPTTISAGMNALFLHLFKQYQNGDFAEKPIY